VALAAVVIPFVALVIAIVLLWKKAVGATELLLLAGMYTATLMGITVGYHRLISHRAFETMPVIRNVLAILGSMAAQGPVLHWAAIHRRHHSFADRPGDPHSPHMHGEGPKGILRGLWHAHTGWLFVHEITDWAHYAPELLRDKAIFTISQLYFLWIAIGLLIPTVIGGLAAGDLHGALYGFLWGGLVRISLVHHTTWSVNSICHVYGSRPYKIHDRAANNPIMAILAFGEGWHNNHHAFPTSAMHGFRWWQIDLSGYVIRTLQALGLAWNLKLPFITRSAGQARYQLKRRQM